MCIIVLDSGGEETAEGKRETQTGLHPAGVSTGGVEMEERVSLHVNTITSNLLFSRHHVCLTKSSSVFLCVCFTGKETRSTTS